MAKDTVGIGIIGTGFGVRVHLPIWAATPHAKVVAIHSSNIDRAKQVAERFEIPHATSDHAELASLPDVDLVLVTTPPYDHLDAVMTALDAGKHVLVEKPFALNATDAKAMLDRAQQKGVVHAINFEFRIMPARLKMRQMIQDGFLGALSHVHTTGFGNFVHLTEGRTARWWYTAAMGGGWLGASGSHDFDTLRFFFGDIEAVSAQLQTVVKEHRLLKEEGLFKPDVDDTFFATVRFKSGGLGILMSSAASATGMGPKRFEAYGSKGTLVLDGERLYAGKMGDEDLSEIEVPDHGVAPHPDPHYPAMTLWSRKVIDAVREGRQMTPSFEDGFKSQQFLDAARKSSAEGVWVPIDA